MKLKLTESKLREMVRKIIKENFYSTGPSRLEMDGFSKELSEKIEDTVDGFLEYWEGRKFKNEETVYRLMVKQASKLKSSNWIPLSKK